MKFLIFLFLVRTFFFFSKKGSRNVTAPKQFISSNSFWKHTSLSARPQIPYNAMGRREVEQIFCPWQGHHNRLAVGSIGVYKTNGLSSQAPSSQFQHLATITIRVPFLESGIEYTYVTYFYTGGIAAILKRLSCFAARCLRRWLTHCTLIMKA